MSDNSQTGTTTGIAGAPAIPRWRSPTMAIGNRLFATTLRDRGPMLNMARLMTSRHLADLQWIAVAAASPILIALATLLLAVPVVILLGLGKIGQAWFGWHLQSVIGDCNYLLSWVGRGGAWFKRNLPILTTVLGALLAIFNWTYQAANRRLGTIDLFACEIGTICRVWLVIDFARRAVDTAPPPRPPEADAAAPPDAKRGWLRSVLKLDGAPRPAAAKAVLRPIPFTTQDDYTPVYDGQLAELVPFDVEVVTAVTQFYTYRKTMVDYMRSRAAAAEDQAPNITKNMLYMLFLSCEAGRKAIDQLVEFEPNKAESIINILCSEVEVYGYLLDAFATGNSRDTGDYRYERLCLRRAEYRTMIERLRRECDARAAERAQERAAAGEDAPDPHRHWTRADVTLPELERRYRLLCQEYPRARPERGASADHA